MLYFVSGIIGGFLIFTAGAVVGTGVEQAGRDHGNVANISVMQTVAVNRESKGDRLTSSEKTSGSSLVPKSGSSESFIGPANGDTDAVARMPVGCEPAVSIVLNDELARTPSRCVS